MIRLGVYPTSKSRSHNVVVAVLRRANPGLTLG